MNIKESFYLIQYCKENFPNHKMNFSQMIKVYKSLGFKLYMLHVKFNEFKLYLKLCLKIN